MSKSVHIFDLGVARYVERLHEAENARLVKNVKKADKPVKLAIPLPSFIMHMLRKG